MKLYRRRLGNTNIFLKLLPAKEEIWGGERVAKALPDLDFV